MLCPFSSSAQRGHDDDVSSTSEDDGYPEDMDQEKHDDSSDDSDTDRSDGESEGDEFAHRDDNDRDNNEEKKSGLCKGRLHGVFLFVYLKGRIMGERVSSADSFPK